MIRQASRAGARGCSRGTRPSVSASCAYPQLLDWPPPVAQAHAAPVLLLRPQRGALRHREALRGAVWAALRQRRRRQGQRQAQGGQADLRGAKRVAARARGGAERQRPPPLRRGRRRLPREAALVRHPRGCDLHGRRRGGSAPRAGSAPQVAERLASGQAGVPELPDSAGGAGPGREGRGGGESVSGGPALVRERGRPRGTGTGAGRRYIQFTIINRRIEREIFSNTKQL